MRAAVALVTAAAFLLTGCSGRPTAVPKRDLAPETNWAGLYRITTASDQFNALHFSIENQTLVIRELGGKDKHYGKVTVPITIPLDEVKSVERLDSKGVQRGFAIATVAVVGLFITAVILATQSGFGSSG